MSYRIISHHQATQEAIERHDQTKPFAPENGQPLEFKAGQQQAENLFQELKQQGKITYNLLDGYVYQA